MHCAFSQKGKIEIPQELQGGRTAAEDQTLFEKHKFSIKFSSLLKFEKKNYGSHFDDDLEFIAQSKVFIQSHCIIRYTM